MVNEPTTFKEELVSMSSFSNIKKTLPENDELTEFALLFCTSKDEVDALFGAVCQALVNDATLWFCYPKGTSKKYKSSISRDKGWETLGSYGFEPVRLISIDEDWSALRFRKVENIKTLTRGFAISEEGKRRTSR